MNSDECGYEILWDQVEDYVDCLESKGLNNSLVTVAFDPLEGAHECSTFATCADTFGSYNCTCDLGWTGDGFNCTEVDECKNKIDALRAAAPPHLIGEYSYCDEDAFCTNTDGGYNCTCNDGFQGDGFNCTDIDECLEGKVKVYLDFSGVFIIVPPFLLIHIEMLVEFDFFLLGKEASLLNSGLEKGFKNR